MRSLKAFIVAAGLGERLRPITDHIPKPLLPVLGRPVIDSVLGRISALPVEKIGINMHYKWEAIRDWAAGSALCNRLALFRENDLLGTGGALKNAESLLRCGPFIVHNADIVSDIDLRSLIEAHEQSRSLATLAVHDHPAFNNVWIDDSGRLKAVGRHGPAGARARAFTGIAVYSPDFLGLLPDGRSSVVDSWLLAVSLGRGISTADVTGCSWTDIGTPTAYFEAVHDALVKSGEQLHVASSVDCSGLDFEDWAVVEEGCSVRGRSTLRRAVTMPGATLEPGSVLQDAIAGPGYIIRDIAGPGSQQDQGQLNPYLSNSLFLKNFIASRAEVLPVGLGGSDRRYYRVRNPDRSVIILRSPEKDADLGRQIIYTGFFRRHSVAVPELLGMDEKEGSAVFEDLGDQSLYSWLKCRRDPAAVEVLYMRVLDILITLHTLATDNVDKCPPLRSRVFDYEHLRWETAYFLEQFVRGVAGLEPENMAGLQHEFALLAKAVDACGKTIVHRDFQSQNIMVRADTNTDTNTVYIPRLIDYQGARMGPPAYDLASMLWDPYYVMEAGMRERLVEYYCRGVAQYRGMVWDKGLFLASLLPCRLQRHMQALGAYGFLSKVKGKMYFLKHVPRALAYLKAEAGSAEAEFPCLFALVKQLHDNA